MTYKKFLDKIETLLIMDVISIKDKKVKKSLRDIIKLIVLFKMTKEKWWKIQENLDKYGPYKINMIKTW